MLPAYAYNYLKLSVGKSYTSDYISGATSASQESCYNYGPLRGQIEMLATSGAFCEKATLDTLATELKTYTKVCEFDELGMLRKTEVHCAGSSILSDVITYKKNDKNTTQCVANEKFTHNGTVRTREYDTDSYGRVTSVTDSVLGSHTYEYDYRGFLVTEDDTVYEYDGNGNITRAGDKVFTYDSVIKDRLMSVDGKAITYSESNPLNPKTYDGKTFEFEGRRLVKVSSGNMVATYKYDDTGLRTEKTVTKNGVATTTKFVYNGGKLIAEYTGTKRVAYLYDENGMLYGFIYNNAKYFYIRDTLQNILGIVDANGNAVVHYNYTAYGECKAITGSKASTIGMINSFRYKGYYFDAETELFYCNARYYSPDFCRFISPDSAQYLEPENINGLNLYAYCNNDPMNYADPSGNSAMLITHGNMAIGVITGIKMSCSVLKMVAKTLFTSKSNKLNLFGYELRTSSGWDTSPDIATSFFGRIGFSSYVTHTRGQSGLLYAFAGSTYDVMNLFETTYSAGVGMNFSDVLGVETHLETVGIGAQVSVGNFSVGANINLIGGTSVTFGRDTDLGNGLTKTDGFTVGINTGCLVAVIQWIYKFAVTGDPTPVYGLQFAG